MRGYVLGPGEGLAADPALKASRASTGGTLTLVESRTTGGAPAHVHHREDEAMYVLDGAITVRCGGEDFELGPRSFVFLPRGVAHRWDVRGEVATVLIIAAPAGLEVFLSEFHRAQDATERRRIAERHGITFV